MNRAGRRALVKAQRECAKRGHLVKRGVRYCLECGQDLGPSA